MAMACSVLSLAMMVKLLIWYRSLICRSCKESLKSAATSADWRPAFGEPGEWLPKLERRGMDVSIEL